MKTNHVTQINKKTFFKVVKCILLFNFLILLINSTFFTQVNAEEIGYYQYDSRLNAWVWISKPWRPTAATTLITISVKGLPPEYSTELIIDGKPIGVIRGGENKRVEVDKKSSHVIQVDKEVRGALINYEGVIVGTRYLCPGNLWNIELVFREVTEVVPVWYRVLIRNDSSYYWDYYVTYEYRTRLISDLVEKGHVFEYIMEHEVYVMDPYGVKSIEWVKDGESIILSAKNLIVIKDEPNVKERAIFKNWIVNGILIENNVIPLKIDKPTVAIAEYIFETKYKVNVYSEFGTPLLSKPDGWYFKGEDATVSIEPEISMKGWKGIFGGKIVFNGWYSEKGLESKSVTFNFVVDEPKNLEVKWVIDESRPIIIVLTLTSLVIAVFIFILYKKSFLLNRLKHVKSESNELARLKAEVEKLKRIVEAQSGKPIE